MITWTETETSRHASLGDVQGGMVSCGSRWAWKVGNDGGLDDEATAKARIEELLLAAQRRTAPAPAPAPAASARVVRQRWTAEQYLADPRVSRSDLELFRCSPALYFGRKVSRTIPDKDTAALRIGRLLHLAVLEPAEFARRVVVAPETDDDFKGKGAKARREAWKSVLAEWRASQPADAIVLDADDKERERVEGMARSLRTTTTAAARAARGLLFGTGESEVSLTWRDDDPELARPIECRARLDRLLTRASGSLVVDLKSTNDPSEEAFSSSIARYGYHRQAAHYCHAAQALLGSSLPRFAFVVVRSEPPYEVAVYELEPEAITIGAFEIRETMRALSRALVEQKFAAPWECGVTKINLPMWARKKGEQALAGGESR